MEWWYRAGNPAVGAILRSPFHPLVSRSLVLISFSGRRSGRTYTIPAMYAREGDRLIVISGPAEDHTWWRNLRGGVRVHVRLRGRGLDARADAIAGGDAPGIVAEGARVWLARFPKAGHRLGIRDGRGRDVDPRELLAAAEHMALVRVTLPPGT